MIPYGTSTAIFCIYAMCLLSGDSEKATSFVYTANTELMEGSPGPPLPYWVQADLCPQMWNCRWWGGGQRGPGKAEWETSQTPFYFSFPNAGHLFCAPAQNMRGPARG